VCVVARLRREILKSEVGTGIVIYFGFPVRSWPASSSSAPSLASQKVTVERRAVANWQQQLKEEQREE